CYGISLTHAAMRVTGKLAWWEDALDKMLAWDGRADSLEQEYILMDADENKPITLKAIFERMTHYIVFNQADCSTYPSANYSQHSFLHPGGLFMMQKGNEILRIKNNYSIAGYFTQDELIHILNDSITIEALK